jgi:hypothetical protein
MFARSGVCLRAKAGGGDCGDRFVLAARAGHTPLAIHPLVGTADLMIAAQEFPDILTRLQDRSACCAARSISLFSVSFVLSRLQSIFFWYPFSLSYRSYIDYLSMYLLCCVTGVFWYGSASSIVRLNADAHQISSKKSKPKTGPSSSSRQKPNRGDVTYLIPFTAIPFLY